MDGNLLEKIKEFKLPIALSIVGLVLIIGGIFTSGLNKKVRDFPKESLVESSQTISVDVSGAVKKAGVYKLREGSRIEEAISAAGGFSETANGEYISKYLNMAQKLSDGTKIYVPIVGDQVSGSSGGGTVAGTSATAKVNINTATQTELEVLPGVGPGYASKIISDRPYNTTDDLLSKKTVTKSIFEKIKEQIVVY